MSADIDLFNCKIEKLGPVLTRIKLLWKFDNTNICNPCVIKRPTFFQRNSQNWLMFFSHHNGKEIRLAYANQIEGKWIVDKNELFSLRDVRFPREANSCHIASPDVLIEKDKMKIFFHAPYYEEQLTFTAITKDGVNFDYDLNSIGMFYFRNIKFKGEHYGIAKYRNEGGVIYKYLNNQWVEVARILPQMRHCCVYENQYGLWILWTEIGERPEIIYVAKLDFDKYEVNGKRPFLHITERWEGSKRDMQPGKPGAAVDVNQLRDPYLVDDNNLLYLFYTFRGERGVAIARIRNA